LPERKGMTGLRGEGGQGYARLPSPTEGMSVVRPRDDTPAFLTAPLPDDTLGAR